MKYLSFLILLISTESFAQCRSYILGVNGDTLNCVDQKGKKQGRWVIRVDDLRGERGYEEEGMYLNDRREGTWRRYSLEGDMIATENYRWGNKNGRNVYFTMMGEPLREETWKSVNPDDPYDTVAIYDINDPTKIVRTEVVKLEGYSLKHGTWKYYDPMTGRIEKTENWFLDKPARRTGDGDDDLAPIDVTDNASAAKPAAPKTTAKPKEVMDFEKKNTKKKIKVRDGSTGG